MQFWLLFRGYFFLHFRHFRVFYSITNQILFFNELKSKLFLILDMDDEQTLASAIENLR